MSSTTAVPRPRDPLRNVAIACGGMIAVALLLVAVGRQDRPVPAIDPAAVASAVELRFDDAPNGTVVASDASSGEELERFGPGEGGFIRVTMRSFASERKQRGFGSEVPFSLTRLKDRSLILQDRLTGRRMLLNAFGPSNEGAFAELLDRRRTTP